MSKGFNAERIKGFLEQSIVLKELKRFCDYYSSESKKVNEYSPLLGYVRLGGDKTRPDERARELVEKADGLGYLDNLVFYLVEFCSQEINVSSQIVTEGNMHEELCIAGQELWRRKTACPRAVRALNRLATLDEDFDQEWTENDAKTALKEAPSLGSNKSVVELVNHLAKCRELYSEANRCREDHQWLEARTTFLELNDLQPGYCDVSEWLSCLGDLSEVRRLQKIIDAAEAGFVYDDRLPWETDYPYLLFQQMGTLITPYSSMDEIQDALPLPDLQGDASREQRACLKNMLQVDQRLFVDAFLYPMCPSKETAYQLEDLLLKGKGRLPGPENIKEQFPEEAGVILYLVGRPAEASAMWKESQRSRPRSGQLAHCQGLLYLGQAYSVGRELQAVVEDWQKAIGHWAVTLADEMHWKAWGRERAQHYARRVLTTPIKNLREKVSIHLEDLLLDTRHQFEDAGKIEWAAAFGNLHQDMLAEFAAVRLSKNIGGFAIGPGRRAWFGPLWMAHFGLEEALAHHMATVAADESLAERMPEGLPLEETMRRLRWFFSYLRTATALLEGSAPNPRRALDVLEEQRPTSPCCSDPDCLQYGGPTLPVPVCCPHGERFAQENPAYAQMKTPQAQMREDALRLAIESHLWLAQAQIKQVRIEDRKALQNAWQEALKLAELSKRSLDVRPKIRPTILNTTRLPLRTRDLADLDAGLALLQLYRSTCSDDDQAISVRLAELLAIRGAIKQRQSDWAGAEEDLRRALAIAPHSCDVQVRNVRKRLAGILLAQVESVAYKNRFRALDLLRQAEELIRDGEQISPGDAQATVLDNIKRARESLYLTDQGSADTQDDYAHLSQVLSSDTPSRSVELYSEGIRLAREGRLELALETLTQVLDMTADDIAVQNAIANVVLDMAAELIDEENHDQGLDLVEHWIPRLGTQENMPCQLEFLGHWPRLKSFFEELDMRFKIHEYREVWLPFKRGEPWVIIHFEGDNLCMRLSLPSFPSTQAETVLLNLLLVSSEILLFKVATHTSASGWADLSLRCVVPFCLFNAMRLATTSLSIFRYAEVLPEKLSRFDELQRWFQDTRASLVQDSLLDKDAVLAMGEIEAFCREQGTEYQRERENRYRVKGPFGQVEVETRPEGFRFWTHLGLLRQEPGHRLDALKRVMELNTSLGIGKLSLAEDQGVILSIEYPCLDHEATEAAFDFFKEQVPELKQGLVVVS